MSNEFAGVTFPWQKVTPSDDAAVRARMLTDGVLYGCGISYLGSTLTMQAGQCIACGRQIRHKVSENWAITGATSGYARLLLTVDLTGVSTEDAFNQVGVLIQYASTVNGFPSLRQDNINDIGTYYQVPVCVVSLGSGGITGIVSQWSDSVPALRLKFGETYGYTLPENPADGQFFVLIGE